MARIDWPEVLDKHGIEYVDSGPSTAKGNIYVHCPMCGDADQGHHMGISIRGRGWGCWRNESHRGKNPFRLLAALLNVSYEQAREMLGGAPLPEDATVGQLVRKALQGTREAVKEDYVLELPREFQLLHATGSAIPYWNYVHERGYSDSDIERLCKHYFLHYAISGLFKYRVIFPIYTQKGLVTWTGRTIVPQRQPRYLTCTTNALVADGGPVAKESIKNCLFDEASLLREKGRAIVVGEGPFDGMRLDFVGRPMGIRGTCLFGKTISNAQVDTLAELSDRYEHKVLLLDPDAALQNLSTLNKLAGLGFRTMRLGGTAKDPAEAKKKHIERFFNRLLGEAT